jgi:hypothetical protein
MYSRRSLPIICLPLLSLCFFAAFAKAQEPASTAASLTPKLNVDVYFFEGIDKSTVVSAERVATEIFKQSAIDVDWRNCPGTTCARRADGPEFRLAIYPQIGNLVTDHAQAKLMRENGTLGLAIHCAMTDSVCFAHIFYGPIRRAALEEEVSTAVVMGHVMAHEIGHALLGPDSHARTGVMQSRLLIAGLERFLHFTSRESEDLVANLMQRNRMQGTTRENMVGDDSLAREVSDQSIMRTPCQTSGGLWGDLSCRTF